MDIDNTDKTLYIFAIGGTGSRVLRSLLFLLASGIKINAKRIVPIIIDPDRSNGDLTRTFELLKNYNLIRDKIKNASGISFFSTQVSSLGNLSNIGLDAEEYRLVVTESGDIKFQDYIQYDSLNPINKEFMSLLFSRSNLALSMEKGFLGNPNIGSVVLNQLFANNNSFIRAFASSFGEKDRIFIISSIFGGTGAAGFPLILKNLKNLNRSGDNYQNAEFIKNAIVGADVIQPYFGVDKNNEEDIIDKKSFISKTKAALMYYAKTINNQINTLYYLGDTISKNYKNHTGSKEQKNDAHFIEVAAATSILHFMNLSDDDIIGKHYNFFELGIKDPTNDEIYFDHLDDLQKKILKKPLTKFYLIKRYLDAHYNEAKRNQPWAIRGKVKLNNEKQIAPLNSFFSEFELWLKELNDNVLAFKPFMLDTPDNLKKLIKEIEGQESDVSKFFKGKDDFILFDKLLNNAERKIENINHYQKFLEVFDNGTEKLFDIVFQK